jgi:predicted N-acetyltransferase YhbS
MEIRRLTKDDFYALRQLLDRVFSDHNGREVSFARTFPRLFGEENGFAPESHLGAFVDGKLVGTAAMYPLPYVVGGRPIRLIASGNVAVDAAYRGQGIMSALLEAVNRECDRCGDLCYLHGNAVRYGRFGYVAAGIQDVVSGWLIDGNSTVVEALDEATGQMVQATQYDFTPVAIFWVVASVISFLLPVFNWKYRK